MSVSVQKHTPVKGKVPAPSKAAQAIQASKAAAKATPAPAPAPAEAKTPTQLAHADMTKLRKSFIEAVNAYKVEKQAHPESKKLPGLLAKAEGFKNQFEELVNETGLYPAILSKMSSNLRNIDKRLDQQLHTKNDLQLPKSSL